MTQCPDGGNVSFTQGGVARVVTVSRAVGDPNFGGAGIIDNNTAQCQYFTANPSSNGESVYLTISAVNPASSSSGSATYHIASAVYNSQFNNGLQGTCGVFFKDISGNDTGFDIKVTGT